MNRLVLGTTNAGKVREIQQALAGLPWIIEQIDAKVPPVEEDGATFEANACKKALHYARWTGSMALADDSGLEVDALQGAPGVYSARYAGEQASDVMNNARLLAALSGVPAGERGARFRCVLAVAIPGKSCIMVEGICSGMIGFTQRGDSGFGYDPLFVLPDGRTMAELPLEEKNTLSHRGKALQKLRNALLMLAEGEPGAGKSVF